MTTQVVAFDYAAWIVSYPEFAYLTAGQGQNYFNMACQFCDNTGAGLVTDSSPGGQLETLLLLGTSHMAKLLAPTAQGQPASPIVGRVESASEGAVSFTAKYIDPKNATEAFFQQTQYGILYWTLTAQFRTFRYAPRPCYPMGAPGLAVFPWLAARNW